MLDNMAGNRTINQLLKFKECYVQHLIRFVSAVYKKPLKTQNEDLGKEVEGVDYR